MASCSERAYAWLSVGDAAKMLMFGKEAELEQYAQEVGEVGGESGVKSCGLGL